MSKQIHLTVDVPFSEIENYLYQREAKDIWNSLNEDEQWACYDYIWDHQDDSEFDMGFYDGDLCELVKRWNIEERDENMMNESRGNTTKCKNLRRNERLENFRPSDWTIVNTKEDGGAHHYGVKLWGGAGYYLYPYSVWADSMEEALTLVGEYCEKHEPGMIIRAKDVFDEIDALMINIIKENPNKFGFSEEDVETKTNNSLLKELKDRDVDAYFKLQEQAMEEGYIDEWAFATENPDIYLYHENLWIDEWPEDYPSPEDVKEESCVTEAEKERTDVIVKVGNKWRIKGRKIKYWPAEYDTKADAEAALRAYWANKNKG